MRAYPSRAGKVPRFCSHECYAAGKVINEGIRVYGACVRCGGPIMARRRPDGSLRTPPKSQRYCSQSCQVSSQPRQKNNGVGFIDKWGYRVLIRDGRQIPEHRFIMEFILGRSLFAEETVHHKNGVRTDNRPNNLELWSSRHGKGQRVEDKIDFCVDFLKQYPEFLERKGFRIVPVDKDEVRNRPRPVLNKSSVLADQLSLVLENTVYNPKTESAE